MRNDFRARFALVYDKHKKSVLDALPENKKEIVAAEMPSMVIIYFDFHNISNYFYHLIFTSYTDIH